VTDGTHNYSALRIKAHTTNKSYYGGFPGPTTTQWTYTWLSPDIGMVALLESQMNELNPNFTTGTYERFISLLAVKPLPELVGLPAGMELGPAFPNPFNSSTQLTFSLPTEGEVSLSIFDASGREVSPLVQGRYLPGAFQVAWDGTAFPSGVYFARLISGGGQLSRSLTLLK
jgi:hypothetical protein